MKKITHIDAKTIDEAEEALGAGKAVIAGGTDLLGYMKGHVSPNAPDTLVNIKTIPNMDYIKEEGGMLKIGALAKLSDIAKSSLVQANYAALAQAANKVGTPELRNMGTIGGNICQLNRCWYYRVERNSFNCLRKNPAGVCQALLGDNRFHSIFGAVNGCVAVNPSDIAPVLVAFNAKVVTNEEEYDLGEYDSDTPVFFAVNGEKTTILADNEFVTEIQIPTPASGTKSTFLKFALRKAFDFALVSVAVVRNGASGRICLGGVHNLPYRAEDAEAALPDADAAATAAVADASTLPNNGYKVQIAKVLVKKAVEATA